MLRGKTCRSSSLHDTTTADNTMDRQVQQTKHTAMLFTHACALTSTHSSNLVYIIALCMVKSISNMEHASGHIPTSSAVRSSMEQSLPRDARESMYGLWGKAGICASTYASLYFMSPGGSHHQQPRKPPVLGCMQFGQTKKCVAQYDCGFH